MSLKPDGTGQKKSHARSAPRPSADPPDPYRTMFDKNPLPMWVFDSDTLSCLVVNDAAVEHYGYSRGDFLGMTLKDIRPKDEIPRLLDDIAQHHQGIDRSGVWTHRKKDGSLIEVEITSHELEFDGKKAKLVLARDITASNIAQETLRRTEERYRTALDHMLEGFQIINFDFRYLYINDAAAGQGRRTSKELLGHTMIEMYPGIESTLMFAELRNCMEARTPHRLENKFAFPDGSSAWFDLAMEPVPEGAVILSREITKEKNLEAELRRHREHLEEMVNERTARLEEANRELEAFSYSVSHDLRAPLRHIDGFAELLQKHSREGLDDKGKRLLTTISGAAKEMGVLIDELLIFSKMGRLEMQKSRVEVSNLVRNVIHSMNQETEGRKVKWDVGPLPVVLADPSMLRLVYENILGNALKYTRPRESAEIQIGARLGDDETVFFVRDNGVGFDMQYIDKLFGVFQRLHSSGEFEGTGIGLANVRRIIQRHGGRTWAEGEVGRGATIYFSVPVVKKG